MGPCSNYSSQGRHESLLTLVPNKKKEKKGRHILECTQTPKTWWAFLVEFLLFTGDAAILNTADKVIFILRKIQMQLNCKKKFCAGYGEGCENAQTCQKWFAKFLHWSIPQI